MGNYRVIVLRVQGINKKTYEAGEIVSDENFPEGVAYELCKKGYLRSETKDDESKMVKAEEKAKADADKTKLEAENKAKAEKEAEEKTKADAIKAEEKAETEQKKLKK
jgi:hypothetical protein